MWRERVNEFLDDKHMDLTVRDKDGGHIMKAESKKQRTRSEAHRVEYRPTLKGLQVTNTQDSTGRCRKQKAAMPKYSTASPNTLKLAECEVHNRGDEAELCLYTQHAPPYILSVQDVETATDSGSVYA